MAAGDPARSRRPGCAGDRRSARRPSWSRASTRTTSCASCAIGLTLRFALLAELTAVDYWPREPRFEIVYILVSIEQRRRVRVKVALHGDDAHLATVSDLWPAPTGSSGKSGTCSASCSTAIRDIRRLLMPEDWEGHPLRKDYPVQIRMQPHVSEPIQVTAEEFRASVEKDRLARK